MIRRYALALSALLALAHLGQAATLHVSKTGDGSDGLSWPTAYTTISDAIDAATAGDEIWVASGTYNEAIRMVTGVLLFGGFDGGQSENRSNLRDWISYRVTISALDLDRPVVTVADGVTLDGLTIRDGRSVEGAGVWCHNATVTLRNCMITRNVATAGINPPTPSTVIVLGGGIYAKSSSLFLDNCEIVDNYAFAYAVGGMLTSASSRGGGIYATQDTHLQSNGTVIRGNQCGATADRGTPYLEVANALGGGICWEASGALTLKNCLIVENSVYSNPHYGARGGGVWIDQGSLEVVQSTVANNVTSGDSYEPNSLYSGIGSNRMNIDTKIVNCILWNGTLHHIFGTIDYNLIAGRYLGSGGEGNIDADPGFVNAVTDPDEVSFGSFEGDYRLQYGSPCIDAGTITETMTDLDGNARPVDIPEVGVDGPGAFDMGGYEYQFPKSDLNANGYTDPMDLFILGGDWMKVTGASGR